jgi:hypothetical protein
MEGGDFIILGGTVDLSAPTSDFTDTSGNQWDGMLVYMPYENEGTIEVTGNADTALEGAIYAPGPASNPLEPKCQFHKNGDTSSVNLQWFCYTLQVTGNVGINLIELSLSLLKSSDLRVSEMFPQIITKQVSPNLIKRFF